MKTAIVSAAILAASVTAIMANPPTKIRGESIPLQVEDITPIEAGPTPGWRRWRINGIPIQARYRGETATGNIVLELQDGSQITPRPEHCDVLSMNGSPLEE